ncbi:tetratricopeptide repeat protein [Moraxella catarrhalis]|uniref:tetratricopeptide repeat protein n=1 Tax=Moraxella catarrhalis TaxID=480 RepID=UPI001D0D9A9D|nr:tetratricopeptide repeat protein [Moraxella catarrhalis]
MNAKTPNPKTAITMATSVIFMLSVMAGTPSWATDGDAVQTNQTSQNSTTAQKADEFFELAVRYDQASDYAMAVREYQKAAELGHVEAMYNLAVAYFQGDGVQQNYQKAHAWYQKAADMGHASAKYNLGSMYFYGQGVAANQSHALVLWQQAAKQGNAKAAHNIGVYYYKSNLEQNKAAAKQWFLVSCQLGLSDGCVKHDNFDKLTTN